MSKEKRYKLDRPFLQLVGRGDKTILRVRQATTLGYAECPVGGCVDLLYPSSPYRRARTIGGGYISNTITSCNIGLHVFIKLKRYDSTDQQENKKG